MWEYCCSTHQKVAIAAPREHAKAQALTSKVKTLKGWTTIGELKVGDKIIGGDGRTSRVTHLHPISEMDLYRVTLKDGRSTLCNLDHLWNVYINSNQRGVLQTLSLREILPKYKNLRKGRFPGDSDVYEHRIKIPSIKPIQYSEKKVPIEPYVLGMWLGDGTSSNANITTADDEIFNHFPYTVTKRSAKYLYNVLGLHSKLRVNNLLHNKHIPEIYFRGSIKQRLELLQGLMDSDGTCHQDGLIAYFCNKNKLLIDGVIELIRSLGGIATLNEQTTKCNGKEFASWRVSCKLPKKLCPFKLSRKVEKWKGSITTDSYIYNIEKETRTLGRCITVERDTYITDDYILTHNSSAITFAFVMACICLGVKDHVLIVSAVQDTADQFLGTIKTEFEENVKLSAQFGYGGVKGYHGTVDNVSEFIFILGTDTESERKIRIKTLGSGNKPRGTKWGHKRPNLIIGDDLEEDEQVLNQERRTKFSKWMNKALIPALSNTGHIRIVGTILHSDSFLESCMPLNQIYKEEDKSYFVRENLRQYYKKDNVSWHSIKYRGHTDDFSELLWPGYKTKEWFQAKKRDFEKDHDLDGYAQEYLNEAIDESVAFFNQSMFLEMEEKHFKKLKNMKFYCGVDFAISTTDKANYTVFMVIGIDDDGFAYVVKVERGRMDITQIAENFFNINMAYKDVMFIPEKGQLWLAVEGLLLREQRERGLFLNIDPIASVKDKLARSQATQRRMKARSVYFDKTEGWYGDLEMEMRSFPRGKNDDQVDALSNVFINIGELSYGPTDEDREEELYDELESQYFEEEYDYDDTANFITGY